MVGFRYLRTRKNSLKELHNIWLDLGTCVPLFMVPLYWYLWVSSSWWYRHGISLEHEHHRRMTECGHSIPQYRGNWCTQPNSQLHFKSKEGTLTLDIESQTWTHTDHYSIKGIQWDQLHLGDSEALYFWEDGDPTDEFFPLRGTVWITWQKELVTTSVLSPI